MSDQGTHPDESAVPSGDGGSTTGEDTVVTGTAGRPTAESGRDGAGRRTRPATRRHLIVLAIALAGFVVGVTLVVTGRTPPERPSSTTGAAASPRGPLLPSLGGVADQRDATALVAKLDPRTLGVADGDSGDSSSAPPSVPNGLDLTVSGLQRCQGAIAQQNPDRSLGSRLAAARLSIDDHAHFVVSYVLPASGAAPAGTRVVIVDARTCRVVGAIDH